MRSMTKLTEFIRGPRGQQLIHKAQRYAAKPENQRRIAQLRARLAARRKPPH
ncbi:MAG TPA: hypothetical protein VMU51_08175 [Mycobacteriales bacterium]|nr:hypothetical protein [Mycobacteriales bacterium]